MKKALALLLSVILLLSALSAAAYAAVPVTADNDYPVVYVPGYSGSELDLVQPDGTKVRVWHPDFMDEIKRRILNKLAEACCNIISTVAGDPQKLADEVGAEAVDLLGVLACDSNGESINNIVIETPGATERCMQYLLDHDMDLPEGNLFVELAQSIGAENIFFLQEDWRMSAVQCAAQLDTFIQEVKAITGKDKVNLIAVSHGGQVSSTYLSLYGDKQDVNNAVLTVPACGGAALAYDIMSENVHLDEYTLVYFLQHGFVTEEDYKWLMRGQELGYLDEILADFLPYIRQVLGNFRSIWDFIPAQYYDELKDRFLDPVENAGILAYSDRVHYEIMPGYYDAFKQDMDQYGMHICTIAGFGIPSVSGLQETSDAIILTADATGATVAPYGQRFADGYVCRGTHCSDPSHNHLSPSFEIDGSTAYLPETTWYVEELFHGMTFLDPYSNELAQTLLLTDDIQDVHSDPRFPQFHASTNPNNIVSARFDKSPESVLSGEDSRLIVTNISKTETVRISSVLFGGVEYTGSALGTGTFAPGESLSIPIKGKLPAESGRNVQVVIQYSCKGRLPSPNGSRTLNFELQNGPRVAYDANNPLEPADYSYGLDYVLGDDTADTLQHSALGGLIEYLYNWILALYRLLGFGF